MNREIKFRAWDKTYKRMNYKVQVGNTDYTDQNYTCNSIWVDYGDRKSAGWMNADDKCIDLMQFTGLKDKNGKEIYEGDICLIKFDINKVEDYIYNSLTTIEKNCGERMFVVESPLFNTQPELNCDDIQVMANIHENPEPL